MHTACARNGLYYTIKSNQFSYDISPLLDSHNGSGFPKMGFAKELQGGFLR